MVKKNDHYIFEQSEKAKKNYGAQKSTRRGRDQDRHSVSFVLPLGDFERICFVRRSKDTLKDRD